MTKPALRRLLTAALSLALALVLPFLTGQLPQIGKALTPMHFPVLLCGLVAGPLWGFAVGLLAPPLRFFLFHVPPYPAFAAMMPELALYGLVSGLLYRRLAQKPLGIYRSLLPAMLLGRCAWGLSMRLLLTAGGKAFPWSAFVSGAFVTALPGIILQLVLIPVLVRAIEKSQL